MPGEQKEWNLESDIDEKKTEEVCLAQILQDNLDPKDLREQVESIQNRDIVLSIEDLNA